MDLKENNLTVCFLGGTYPKDINQPCPNHPSEPGDPEDRKLFSIIMSLMAVLALSLGDLHVRCYRNSNCAGGTEN